MRTALFLRRSCLRASNYLRCPSCRTFSTSRPHHLLSRRAFFHKPPTPPGRGTTTLLAALSPAAFVSLSEADLHDGKTGEEHMLEASRAEIRDALPDPIAHSSRVVRAMYYVLDVYVWEPICTGLRFLHLVTIFVPVLLSVPVVFMGRRRKERGGEREGCLWWYGFLVRSMERAGAAFIKLGQWAASRTDIFPTEMCAIMSSLHSNAPAHSLAKTKKTIEKAFDGRPFEEIFEEFDTKPLGVGAIAQVYRGKLKHNLTQADEADNQQPQNLRERVRKNVDIALKSTPARIPSSYVAIKVLHPNVERIVRRDLRIMGFFASVINAIPTMEWLSFPDEVAQFGEMMRLQLDLRIEAANLEIFRKHFRDRTTAWFPYPYTQYTTRQVLVEEFAHGIPLEDFLTNGGGVFQKEIANEGLDAFLHMLLIDNFIHADLHPGNIMVRFYKPESLLPADSIPSLPSFTQDTFSQPATSPTSPAENAPIDVTEEVLSRLRPYRHDSSAWRAQLSRIDTDGYRPSLIFLDTGLVTELSPANRRNFLDLFKSVAEFDGRRSAELMIERSRNPEEVIGQQLFIKRMHHLVLGVQRLTFSLGNIKIGDVLGEVLDMVRTHHVRLEGDFVNVVLSILLLEGIGRQLDPGIDLFSAALPILRQLGTSGGKSMLQSSDFSMLKVWAGLEARSFLVAGVESVEDCVKYDELSPNV
ncbi:putative ABC1 family protein [Viridothelium virens]|uniref:Putative ABC1 family protein n=1 Tax=Viridothelium virens TaxID=1048519 RepID=A0A6A6HF38_VIRVR|nr:putative ABC1 family protein [Viridothelium virens]